MRPSMQVLYVSGYAVGIASNDARRAVEDGLAFLEKPYPRGALVRKVREILDAEPVQLGSEEQ